MTDRDAHVIDLPQAGERIASELWGMRDRLEHLERNLEKLFAEDIAKFDSATIAAIQEIDMLMQSAGALAQFVQRVASKREIDGKLVIDDALSAVTLRDMALRLQGQQNKGAQSGMPELF